METAVNAMKAARQLLEKIIKKGERVRANKGDSPLLPLWVIPARMCLPPFELRQFSHAIFSNGERIQARFGGPLLNIWSSSALL